MNGAVFVLTHSDISLVLLIWSGAATLIEREFPTCAMILAFDSIYSTQLPEYLLCRARVLLT